MVFVIFIKNPQEGFVVSSATLKDDSGTELNTGLGINSVPDDQTRFTIDRYPDSEFAAGQFKGQSEWRSEASLEAIRRRRKQPLPWT